MLHFVIPAIDDTAVAMVLTNSRAEEFNMEKWREEKIQIEVGNFYENLVYSAGLKCSIFFRYIEKSNLKSAEIS